MTKLMLTAINPTVREMRLGRAWSKHRPTEVHIVGHIAAVQHQQWRENGTKDKAEDEPGARMAGEGLYVT